MKTNGCSYSIFHFSEKLEAKYVLPNINRTQAAESASRKMPFFVRDDLDL